MEESASQSVTTPASGARAIGYLAGEADASIVYLAAVLECITAEILELADGGMRCVEGLWEGGGLTFAPWIRFLQEGEEEKDQRVSSCACCSRESSCAVDPPRVLILRDRTIRSCRNWSDTCCRLRRRLM